MLRAIVRGGTSLAKKKPPSGRLAQEDADVHKLFLATQFRERLLDLDDGDDGPTTREAVANRVLEASTRCTSLERKENSEATDERWFGFDGENGRCLGDRDDE